MPSTMRNDRSPERSSGAVPGNAAAIKRLKVKSDGVMVVSSDRLQAMKRALVCLSLLCFSVVFGQNSALQGEVRDASDAVVAGARIIVTNMETGVRHETTSNDSGLYTLPSLPAGPDAWGAPPAAFNAGALKERKTAP